MNTVGEYLMKPAVWFIPFRTVFLSSKVYAYCKNAWGIAKGFCLGA